MEILRLSANTIDAYAERAAEVVRSGGVVLYPTDTLYGLGADALSDTAVAKIYEIKGREELKPIHGIVADLEIAERYGEINEEMRVLGRELPKGKITFVVKKKNFNTGITHGIDTFGFRIPDNDFCIALSRAFDGPITATSANKSGSNPERSVEKILAQLGDASSQVDLVIDAGELQERKPSTVIDMTGDRPLIVREGAIPAPDIWNAIHDEY